jgi:hypothetical protein
MKTQQNLPEELKMFEPLFNGPYLNQSNLKSVFFVERKKMIFNSPNIFGEKKNFPSDNECDYFVAEFWFEYPSINKQQSTYFVYSHIFNLKLEDLAKEIEIENKSLTEYEILSTPEMVAEMIEKNYDNVKSILLDINENGDYKSLAIKIVEYRGKTFLKRNYRL